MNPVALFLDFVSFFCWFLLHTWSVDASAVLFNSLAAVHITAAERMKQVFIYLFLINICSHFYFSCGCAVLCGHSLPVLGEELVLTQIIEFDHFGYHDFPILFGFYLHHFHSSPRRCVWRGCGSWRVCSRRSPSC